MKSIILGIFIFEKKSCLVPGLDQMRIAMEAAKGIDLWKAALEEGKAERDQEEEFVGFLKIPNWSFLWGNVGFSEGLKCVDEIWTKDDCSGEEFIIGLFPSSLFVSVYYAQRWRMD